MKQVVINADDFGYSLAVNRGVIKAYKDGVVSSTTLMANMPGCIEAIKLANENKDLGVGCHLNITTGKPMTDAKTLVDENGEFYHLAGYKEHRNEMDPEEIYHEWCAQVDFLLSKGVKLTHLDSHHHVHSFSENLTLTQRISDKYQLPVRNCYGIENQVKLSYQRGIVGFDDLMNYAHIRSLDKSYHADQEQCLTEIQAVLDRLQDNQITEFMVHPAFVDETLYFNSSFNVPRIKEVTILCDSAFKKKLQENQVEVIPYPKS